MARNKYPEETVQLILDTAQRLFWKKAMTTPPYRISWTSWAA